ncbi:hypothetical protein [Methanocella sp. MCL-LM]|uniref:hypothetical protein n=1 Tax=Methanocella sp. MCL-LM TaxID=3412035 RepID=UPI003C78E659
MSALTDIALTMIAGFPLVVWLGVATITLLLSTAVYGYGLMKGKIRGTITTHMRIAGVTMILALIHAILAVSIFI